MAIYTNYGRYLKAKQFKESLQERGDIYMVFGLGNPRWDYATNHERYQGQMPIAPYNTSILLKGDNQTNQFYDNHINAYYHDANNENVKYILHDGSIVKETATYEAPDFVSPTPLNESAEDKVYLSECKDIIPVFPGIWQHYSASPEDSPVLLTYTGGVVRQDNYHEFYIKGNSSSSTGYSIYECSTSGYYPISVPSDTEAQQYFAELYLRGLSDVYRLKHPIGLLGAVRCDINFVKDIGGDDNNTYTGSAKQFWYGDRYWEIVEPDETYVENYVGDKLNQEIYPHHLIITATVNPRNLCAELAIDQCIVPRQIAIYSRPIQKETYVDEHDEIQERDVHSKNYYRVGENIFNFGQYTKSEWDTVDSLIPSGGEKLNFALPCKFKPNKTSSEIEYPGDPDTDFKFILHDYIKGSVREDKHAIDRFGYVIGF